MSFHDSDSIFQVWETDNTMMLLLSVMEQTVKCIKHHEDSRYRGTWKIESQTKPDQNPIHSTDL